MGSILHLFQRFVKFLQPASQRSNDEVAVIFLNQTEKEHLYKIKNALAVPSCSIQSLKKLCDEVSFHLEDQKFSYTYAAILLAVEGKIDDSISLLAYNSKDVFSSVLCDFLRGSKTFVPDEVVFQNASPYNAFVKTNFFNKYQKGILDCVHKFASNVPPNTSDNTVTILDMGTGNGILISKIVEEVAPIYDLKRIRLILLDPSTDMLRTAEENCRKNINIKTDIITICCKAENINTEQMDSIRNMKPIWFINASLSLHHMPLEAKIPLFKKLKTLSSCCVLSEVNWNHDIPEAKSPELIYSVVKGYGLLFKDVLESPITDDEKRATLHKFLLAEAIKIIKEPRPDRVDYHTTIEEWKKTGNAANFNTDNVITTYKFADGQPAAFVITLRS